MLLPEFGVHRRLLSNSIPVSSQDLQALAPLPEPFERMLAQLYDHLGLEPQRRNFHILEGNHPGHLSLQGLTQAEAHRQISEGMTPFPPLFR